MANHIDAQKIENELQQRLNNRMDSVRALVNTRQAVADARELLNAAEDEDARQYQAAIRAGWAAEELRASGLPEPEKLRRVKTRAKRRTSSKTPE